MGSGSFRNNNDNDDDDNDDDDYVHTLEAASARIHAMQLFELQMVVHQLLIRRRLYVIPE